MSELQGGKFGHGFVSAGVTEVLSPVIGQAGGAGPKGVATRAALSAALGGTVSKITGGNFANGAATSAFQSLFNEGVHDVPKKGDDGYLIGIHTNVLPDAPMGAGHAWITIANMETGNVESWGLWPDGTGRNTYDPGHVKSDVTKNTELLDVKHYKAAYSRYYRITDVQYSKFVDYTNKYQTWAPDNNCASWASGAINIITGVNFRTQHMSIIGWFKNIPSPTVISSQIYSLQQIDRSKAGGG